MAMSWPVIGNENVQLPSQFSLGFQGGGPERHDTSITPMSNPLGVGGMAQFDSGGRTFGSGVNISNLTSVHGSFVQHLSNRFGAESCRKEMLVFIERTRTTPLLRLQVDHEIASLNELNRYLVSAEGRAKYGRDTSAERLVADFGFAGVYGVSIAEHAASTRSQIEAMVVIGRRARMTAVTRAFKKKADAVTDRLMDTVHLLWIRRKLVPSDVQKTRDIEGDQMYMKEDIHYWTANLHVSPSNGAPPSWLYIDDESTGMAIRVGTILQYSSNNKHTEADIQRARKSLSGTVNALQEDRAYLKNMPLLPYVDILVNM